MTEDRFYEVMDKCDKLAQDGFAKGYLPSVDELTDSRHDIRKNPERYLGLILYFAADPYKKQGLALADSPQYRAVVQLCREVSSSLEFESEEEDTKEKAEEKKAEKKPRSKGNQKKEQKRKQT